MNDPSDKIDQIFWEALEISSDDERRAFLDQACGGDTRLLQRVEKMLRAKPKAEPFFEKPLAVVAPTIDTGPPTEKLGTYIGRYKLVHEIGQGGMGVVYMAAQKEPVRRKVALKIIKPGMDTREIVARFEAERQALALMDHQSIATVLDGGSTESGRPYFVMELVDGTPITEYCDAAQFTTRQRLELFIQVCQAVQHAHLKGVIHRDIKPSNILVTHFDAAPVPKVIDFGIAKAVHQPLTNASVYTQVAQMIGTPLYMSPEQAERTGQDVDTRTDVYSLGVLLYELLTGTTPFDRERLKNSGLDEVKRIIREEEPPRPSARLSTLGAELDTVVEKHHTERRTLTNELTGELDWIVMRALEKDRTRRYESAHDLAKDVQRYLDDEPVEACPPTKAYRLGKFYRRNKVALAFFAAIALTLFIGAAVATEQAVRAIAAEGEAQEQKELAEQRLTQTNEQRQRAQANYTKAREAVKQMLTRVADEELAAIPEMTEVRTQLMQDARLFYGELIKLNPDDAQAYFERAAVRTTLGEAGEEIVADYEMAIKLAPQNADFERGFSDFILWHLNDLPRVLRHAKRAVELAPNNAEHLAWLARMHGDLGEYDKALAIHEEMVAKAPNSADVYAWRAYTYHAMGNLDDALADARKAVDLEPTQSSGWDAVFDTLVAMKKYDEALVAADRAIEIAGEKQTSDWLYARRGIIQMKLGNTPLALADFQHAVELGPAVEAHEARAAYYKEQGRLEDALADWTSSIQRVPKWWILKWRGWLLFELGRYDEALADIAKAVKMRPDDLSILTWVSPSRVATCPDESCRAGLLKLADKAIELNHKAARAYAARGWILAALGQENLALVDLQTAFDRMPKDDQLGRLGLSETCYELGNLCLALSHREEVRPYLKRMTELRPEEPIAWYFYALAQLGAGQTDAYQATCRRMVGQFSDSTAPADGNFIAWACTLAPDALSDWVKAIALAEKAAQSDPKSAFYLNTWGAVLYRAGRFDDALARLSEAEALGQPSSEASNSSPAYTWFFLAMTQHRLGHAEEAKQWLDKAVAWTDKIFAEADQGTTDLSVNRRLTLKLLREEAEQLLGTPDQPEDENETE